MSTPRPAETPATATGLLQAGLDSPPFAVELEGLDGGVSQLHCERVIRAVPGRRLVCRGEWGGEAVFAKLYLGNRKHWQSELRGLDALQAAGIAAPRVVHAGSADHGAVHVIMLEPVPVASTFEAAWKQAPDETSRRRLLEQAIRTIARHHGAGLEQQDIHLDNFLLSGERLYTIDGGGIRLSGGGELSVRRSLDNLALCLAQFYPHFDYLSVGALAAYSGERHWAAGAVTAAQLQRRIDHFRRRRRRHFLGKVFRNCTAFACDRNWHRFRVHDRAMASGKMLEFLADPDASLRQPGPRYLKQGNTCTLWLARVDDRWLVVKRYNIKGLAHRIQRAFRRTRAAVSWENAHRLGIYGISTARPVALLEQRFGPLRGRAWYISEYVEGEDVLQLCTRPAPPAAAIEAAAQPVVDLLGQLARCRISHGDMKGSNFIVADEGPVLIDLDAMQEHVCGWRYRRAQRRDMQRFMRNWDDCPEVAVVFKKLIRNRKQVSQS